MTSVFNQTAHPARIWALLLSFPVLLTLVLPACTLLDPYKAAQTIEQKAGAVLGDFDIYQQAALAIAKNKTVPANIWLPVIGSARAAKKPMDDLDAALRQYIQIKAAVLAGTSTEDKLATAAAQLNGWIGQAQPLLDDLKKWVGKVKS